MPNNDGSRRSPLTEGALRTRSMAAESAGGGALRVAHPCSSLGGRGSHGQMRAVMPTVPEVASRWPCVSMVIFCSGDLAASAVAT